MGRREKKKVSLGCDKTTRKRCDVVGDGLVLVWEGEGDEKRPPTPLSVYK